LGADAVSFIIRIAAPTVPSRRVPSGDRLVFLSALFAFLHFVAAFGIVATVFFEWLTMSKSPSHAEARHIQLCDRWYGIFAVLVLVVGLLRVHYFEKGASFYWSNPFFRLKLGLFVLLGLLSIYPTVRFIKWRPETSRGMPPIVSASQVKAISIILRLELAVLAGMALAATLMARGVTL
jgi:putative membrane protein